MVRNKKKSDARRLPPTPPSKRAIFLSRPMGSCAKCYGSGQIQVMGMRNCEQCQGVGGAPNSAGVRAFNSYAYVFNNERICNRCGGRGQVSSVWYETCQMCGGSGNR